MKRILTVIMLPLVVGAAAAALAEAPNPPPNPGMGPMGPPPMPPWLDLSLDQQKKVADLRVATAKKVAQHQAEIRVKHAELEALWLAEQPRRDAILKKLAEIDALHAKVREAMVDFELGVLKHLTPAQRQLLGRHRGLGLFHGFGPGVGFGFGGPRWGHGHGFHGGHPGFGGWGHCPCGGPGAFGGPGPAGGPGPGPGGGHGRAF